jgi:chromate transporter
MVNAATMTGFGQAGVPGAALATLGVILPSFLIMLVVPRLQKKWSGHRAIRLTLRGVKPCLAGVICATGVHLAIQLLTGSAEVRFDCVTALLMAGLAIGAAAYQRIRKKQLSPILLIIAAAALGILIY